MHYRYFCLGASYRSTLTFSYEALDSAKAAYEKLTAKVIDLKKESQNLTIDKQAAATYKNQFYAELYNDLGCPKALAVMWNMLKDKDINAATKLDCLVDFDSVFSIGIEKMAENQLVLSKYQQNLIDERQIARANRDWEKSDELRDILFSDGLSIKDLPDGKYEVTVLRKAAQKIDSNLLKRKTERDSR